MSLSSSSQTDPIRDEEAQRAAEIMLSSSLNSINSQNSFSGRLGLHGNTEPRPGGQPQFMYPPSYRSQPPSYGSYLQHPGPGYVPNSDDVFRTRLSQEQHQGPSNRHPNFDPQAMHASNPPPLPFNPEPQNYQHGTGMPPYLPHLHYAGGGRGYGSLPFPVIMTDDLVSGTQHDGRMSPVRRFFLLLCTFDILFTSLLWIISILVTGKDLMTELHRQVVEYSIHYSMFDCVLSAAGRFIFSLLFYGFFHLSHWWPITVTTTGTIGFLIAKVLRYEWHENIPITYNVMLVLLSFILSWGEVWFFDLRMIPLERKAKEIWGGQHQKVNCEAESDERTLLLPPTQGGMLQRFIEGTGTTLYEGSVGCYYSPLETPEDSDDEDDELLVVSGVRIPRKFRRKQDHPLTDQEREYIKMGEEMLASAWDTLNSADWKLEKQLDNGDRVQVKQVNGKKVFRLTGYVNISPKQLLEELFYKMEQVPSWNPTLVECRTIQPIDEYTDISYQVCAEAGGGVVSTRDFVNLRHWAMVDSVYVSAGGSIKHTAMPPQPKKVRGENGPGCWAMRQVEGSPDMCLFQWLLDTDLKGWIPQSIIDKALSGAQFDYIANIRTRAATLGSSSGHNKSIASCADTMDN